MVILQTQLSANRLVLKLILYYFDVVMRVVHINVCILGLYIYRTIVKSAIHKKIIVTWGAFSDFMK